jgi:hypothetical protein
MEKSSQPSSFWHNVLCVSALTYNLFFVFILVLGLFKMTILQNSFSNYTDSTSQSSYLNIYIISMLVFTLSASFGIIKLFSLRKIGFYIYMGSTLSLIILKYLFISTNWIEIGLLFTYMLLFSILKKKYR